MLEEDNEAKTPYYIKPAVRRLFKPDPGYTLFDCDLSGADAQVVAWESGDKELKDAFKHGLNVHNFNGQRLWGEAYSPQLVRRKLTWRDECKRGVHGTNYLSSVRNLAATLGWSYTEVDLFQKAWFKLNPGIREWHQRVEHSVQTRRRVDNKLGFRIIYFDRPSNILPKAVAWIPQSTVAGVCSKGAINLSKGFPWLHILLQVHDSVVFQIPNNRVSPSTFSSLRNHLETEVPYPGDALLIPWGLASSTKSWQDVKKIKWEEVT